LHAELDKLTDSELEIDEALKSTSKELVQATREARKRNKLIEARRRLKELDYEQDRADDYLDDEDEEEDADEPEFNAEAELMKIVEPLIKQKLGLVTSPPISPVPPLTPQNDNFMRDIAHAEIDKLTDEQLLDLAKKLKK